jgi:hypothetical protein
MFYLTVIKKKIIRKTIIKQIQIIQKTKNHRYIPVVYIAILVHLKINRL